MTAPLLLKLYAATVLLLSFGVVLSFQLPNGVRLYMYDLPILFIAPFSCIYLFSSHKFYKEIMYLLAFIFIGLIGLLLSLSAVKDLTYSIAYLGRLLIYLLLSVPIFSFSKKQLLFLLKVIFLSGVVFVILGYLQYFLYPDLANLYYFGWDRHLYRLFSTFLDPNYTGIYLVFVYICSIGIVDLFVFDKRKRYLLITAILFLPAIFLTYSRSAYIALIVTFGTFLFYTKRRYLFIAFAIFIAGLFLLPKNFGGEGVNLLRTNSITARLQANERVISVIIQNPVLGVGFNSLRYAYLRDGSLSFENVQSHAANGAPNSYLYLLATTGILGFSAFSFYFYNILEKINEERKQEKSYAKLALVVFSGIVGILAASFFENAFFFSPIFILGVILIAILIRLSKITK